MYIVEAFEILNISLAAMCRLTYLYTLGVTFLTSSGSISQKLKTQVPAVNIPTYFIIEICLWYDIYDIFHYWNISVCGHTSKPPKLVHISIEKKWFILPHKSVELQNVLSCEQFKSFPVILGGAVKPLTSRAVSFITILLCSPSYPVSRIPVW